MRNLSGKKLLILGGGYLSIDIVKAAQSMGIYTIVTDWYDTKRSPAKLIADEYWNEEVFRPDVLSNLIRANKIDGVLTGFTDSYLTKYCELCKICELPCYATKEQFLQSLDKDIFKKTCISNGIDVVPEYSLNSFDTSILDKHTKIIIKPVDNSGSRGICICDNKESFHEQLNYSMSFSESKHVLLERYMDCDDVSFEYKIQDGEVFLSSICDRHIYKTEHFGSVTSGLIYPSKYTDIYMSDVDNRVREMFQRMGLKNGVLFLQAFAENGKFYFYEMGYRLSGGRHYIFTMNQNQTSSVKELIHFAITGKMDTDRISLKTNPKFQQYCCQLSVLCESKKISKIVGKEIIASMSEIIDALYTYNEGDSVGNEGTSAQIAARFHIVVDTLPKLDCVLNEIRKVFHIYDNCNHDMILPFFR